MTAVHASVQCTHCDSHHCSSVRVQFTCRDMTDICSVALKLRAVSCAYDNGCKHWEIDRESQSEKFVRRQKYFNSQWFAVHVILAIAIFFVAICCICRCCPAVSVLTVCKLNAVYCICVTHSVSL